MKSIDFKSLFIGILVTALVMVLLGQSSYRKQYDVDCFTNATSKHTQCKRFYVNSDMWDDGDTMMFSWDSFYTLHVQ